MKKILAAIIMTFVALSYPMACFAADGFQISIDEKNNKATVSGTDTHIITDTEKESFGITDHPLKDAVHKYFGKAPNDAYLHSSTPWGDLYKKYHWPQVQTTVTALNATLTQTAPQPQIVKTATFKNNSDSKTTAHVNITESVTDTDQHSWSHSNTISVSQSVSYKFLSAQGTTTASYSYQWGESQTKSHSVTIGSEEGIEIELEPGEEVVAELVAYKRTMDITVNYLASLTGDTAVNYNPTYKDHHFWALSITGVMHAADLPTTKNITETISVCNYSDATIQVKSLKTGAVKHKFAAKVTHL